MNETENKNRETRIKQQKQSFFRKLVLCLTAILVITLIFSVVNRNSRGTEIDLNTFEQKLDAGQIKEINLNEERILEGLCCGLGAGSGSGGIVEAHLLYDPLAEHPF